MLRASSASKNMALAKAARGLALSDEPQSAAEITFRNGYAGMIEAFRARANERRIAITSADVAATAGLASHYIPKLLSPSKNPMRRVGMISLGPLLAVLQAKLLLVPDPEAEKLYGARIPQRREVCVRNGIHSVGVNVHFTRKFLREIGAKGGANSRRNLGKRLRRALARKAANARWQKAAAAKRVRPKRQSAGRPRRRRRHRWPTSPKRLAENLARRAQEKCCRTATIGRNSMWICRYQDNPSKVFK
jgi:general stress protein YciG